MFKCLNRLYSNRISYDRYNIVDTDFVETIEVYNGFYYLRDFHREKIRLVILAYISKNKPVAKNVAIMLRQSIGIVAGVDYYIGMDEASDRYKKCIVREYNKLVTDV